MIGAGPVIISLTWNARERREMTEPDKLALPARDAGAPRALCLLERPVRIFQILTLVDASLADERHRLAERFDDGGDQEVAAELDEIRRFQRLGD